MGEQSGSSRSNRMTIKGLDSLRPEEYASLVAAIGRLGLTIIPNSPQSRPASEYARRLGEVGFSYGSRLRDLDEWHRFAAVAGYNTALATRLFNRVSIQFCAFTSRDASFRSTSDYEAMREQVGDRYPGLGAAWVNEKWYLDVYDLSALVEDWQHDGWPKGISHIGAAFLTDYTTYAVESESEG